MPLTAFSLHIGDYHSYQHCKQLKSHSQSAVWYSTYLSTILVYLKLLIFGSAVFLNSRGEPDFTTVDPWFNGDHFFIPIFLLFYMH